MLLFCRWLVGGVFSVTQECRINVNEKKGVVCSNMCLKFVGWWWWCGVVVWCVCYRQFVSMFSSASLESEEEDEESSLFALSAVLVCFKEESFSRIL